MQTLRQLVSIILAASVALTAFAEQHKLPADLTAFDRLQQSALLVSDHAAEIIYSKRPDQLYIPASIVKLLTASLVLDHWGEAYRFSTEIFFDSDSQCLKIVGSGDPFLISEELDRMTTQIKASGIHSIRGIQVDSSFFSRQIDFDGRGNSSNPYDAPYSALAANFNSVALIKQHNRVRSGEENTPLTPMHMQLAEDLDSGQYRISLKHIDQAARYFTQLLTSKLRQQGVITQNQSCAATYAETPWLVFTNSHTLQTIVTAMLKYSNNFIAQQLFLALGADVHGAPASADKSRRVLSGYIAHHFDWQDYQLVEAAGLSRQNKLSAHQIVDILNHFQPYRRLLDRQQTGIYAKTGTLSGVRNYAGYMQHDQHWYPFVILINQAVPYRFREQIAHHIYTQLNPTN